MRRKVPFLFALAAMAIVAGCSRDSSSPTLTAPPVRAAITVTESSIREQIAVVFVDDGLETAANSQFSEVVALVTAGDVNGAQQKARQLIKFITNKDNKGRLTSQPGAVSLLIDAILMYVGLPPAGVPVGATLPTGGVGLIGPEGGYVIAGSSDAALAFFYAAPGTFPVPTMVSLVQLQSKKYAPGASGSPFPDSPFTAYPLYYDITTNPTYPNGFAVPATIGICTVPLFQSVEGADEAIHPNIRMGHERGGTTFEVLPRAAPNAVLNGCGAEAMVPQEDGPLGLMRLARGLGNLVSPRSAYAIHSGPIAQSNNVSPFGSVDVGTVTTVDFESYPPVFTTVQPAVCDGCDITNQWASVGLTFSWSSNVFPNDQANLAATSPYNENVSPPNHAVMWAVNDVGQGEVGSVAMHLTNGPKYLQFERSYPTGGAAPPFTIYNFTSGADITSKAVIVKVETYQSIQGATYQRERISIINPAGISQVIFDMNGTVQVIDNVSFSGTTFTGPA